MPRRKNEPPCSKYAGYVAKADANKVNERYRQLIRACDAANKDPDVSAIEREMDALTDEITEPWIVTR
jgi:hypothetical protein